MVKKIDQELKFVIGKVVIQILEGVYLVVLFLSRKQTRKGKSLAEGYFIASPQSEAVVRSKELQKPVCKRHYWSIVLTRMGRFQS